MITPRYTLISQKRKKDFVTPLLFNITLAAHFDNEGKYSTFKRRLQDWCWLRSQQDLFSVLLENSRSSFASRHDQMAYKASAVTYVIVLVVFGKLQHVLRKEFCLQSKPQIRNLSKNYSLPIQIKRSKPSN